MLPPVCVKTQGRAWGGLVTRSRVGAAGSSYAAVALRSKDQSATGSRLASQATAKLFAQVQGKKLYPEHEEPRTKRLTPVVLGSSCSLRGTYPRPSFGVHCTNIAKAMSTSGSTNPPQALSAMTILWWRRFQGYAGGSNITAMHGL